jgi:hypothetical protein
MLKRPPWVERVRLFGLRIDVPLLDQLTANIFDEKRRRKAEYYAEAVKKSLTPEGFLRVTGAPTTIPGRYALMPFSIAKEQRAAVRPSLDAYQFLHIDWHHAEITAAAHLADEEHLAEKLKDKNFDVFEDVGLKLGVDRKAARLAMYSFVYGRVESTDKALALVFPKLVARRQALGRHDNTRSIQALIATTLESKVKSLLDNDHRVVMVPPDGVVIEVKRGAPTEPIVDLMRHDEPYFRVRMKLTERWS